MKLMPDFIFRQLPLMKGAMQVPLRPPASELGLLEGLLGTWTGTGFNVIWRPNRASRHNHFLELNLTSETLEFEEIRGEIPNRGLLQRDIYMFGVTYLQQIKDFNTEAGLHIEPGIWATVPKTQNPREPATIVRMASIPHGTTVLAQGAARAINGPPKITPADITPFEIDNPANQKPHPESNLSRPSQFRSSPEDIDGVTQEMVDNPNSLLASALDGLKIAKTVVLKVSSNPQIPDVGGGIANTAFLQGTSEPNAQAAQVDSTFWIETVPGRAGRPGFHQLQYTQRVLLNFAGLSWPHISVATLRK
jgi:hypothetical protein